MIRQSQITTVNRASLQDDTRWDPWPLDMPFAVGKMGHEATIGHKSIVALASPRNH